MFQGAFSCCLVLCPVFNHNQDVVVDFGGVIGTGPGRAQGGQTTSSIDVSLFENVTYTEIVDLLVALTDVQPQEIDYLLRTSTEDQIIHFLNNSTDMTPSEIGIIVSILEDVTPPLMTTALGGIPMGVRLLGVGDKVATNTFRLRGTKVKAEN